MKIKTRLFCFLVLIAFTGLHAGVKPTLFDAARLQILLKKLTVVGGALYVGAHPDDENTALLAYWSQGRLVRSAYLSLTRGEGGQNLIGSEQGAMLGLIRTQELLAARDLDHAQQFFTRAIDFGFSKSSEEALRMWGKDNILADVVWTIRKFRPDVIVCRFPTDGKGGHGHHTASAILAQEAFSAAADPSRFPEQLKYVAVWKPTRIVWNYFTWTGPPSEADATKMVKTDIGGYSPLLGLSYTELAGMSRSMHKSQGFGDSEDRGPFVNYFQHLAGEPAKDDLFEGIDLTWKRIAGSEKIAAALEEANQAFRPDNPSVSLPGLLKAYDLMEHFRENPWVKEKKADVLQAIQACSGLWLEAIASDDSGTPGSEVKIVVTAINRSTARLYLYPPHVVNDPRVNVGGPSLLEPNKPFTGALTLQIPQTAPVSQPYWFTEEAGKRIADVNDPLLVGLPESPPGINIRFALGTESEIPMSRNTFFEKPNEPYDELHGIKASPVFVVPVLFRRVDPVRGEVYRRFEIVPDVILGLSDHVAVFAENESKKITVSVTAGGPQVSGEVRLKTPDGWKVHPESFPFQLTAQGQDKTGEFTITPMAQAKNGVLAAEAIVGQKHFTSGMVTIDYPHIPAQTAFPPAEAKLVKVDLQKAGENIGYIMGSGDAIPDSLRQVGYRVTLLSGEDLANADLSHFDAIVVGIRAYNTRADLKISQSRLLEYVNRGGTMVVQYNTLQELDQNALGPYPFQISHDRVSVEDAPVTMPAPDHSLLIFPNKITQEDFVGWIQERGLYFPNQWDSHYETILVCNDPGETPKSGGILFTRYGKGIYIYTGFSWFRELPAGVSGAFRLFVNLISAGKAPQPKAE